MGRRPRVAVRGDPSLDRFQGKEIDRAGDGFLATFDGPARAIRCALEIVERLSAVGVDVRAGIHAGEVELIDGGVGGIAVHTGARVAAAAEPGEVLVTSTVADLVAGAGIDFGDRGIHELKGVPGEWHLLVAAGDSTPPCSSGRPSAYWLWQMRRSLLLAVCVATAVTLPLAADAKQQQASSTRARVNVAFNQKLGLKILVDSRGFTLYLWESDGRDKSTCYSGCDDAWPPLTTVGKPIAGKGVKKTLLRTIRRHDGTRQVTYNHHPLYTDAGSAQLGLDADKVPGDINGHGFANWYAVSPRGKAIHKLP